MPASPPRKAAPFGLWPSPITAADLTRGARSFGHRQGEGNAVYWTESRPQEKGRQVIMRGHGGGDVQELLPVPFSARSRVHEYGGAEFTVADGVVYFISDADQDIWRLEPGTVPERLTNAPEMRFAAIELDRQRKRLIAVGERHHAGAGHEHPDNLIVAVPLEGPHKGEAQPLAQARDFYAFPVLSPSGSQLAFLAWDLPDMPWDQAGLHVAPVRSNGELGRAKRIAGGDGVAAMQPAWLPDGRLVFVSDASGFGNIWVWDGEEARALTRLTMELGLPMWNLGTRSFVVTPDGSSIVAAGSVDGRPVLLSVSELGRRRPTVTTHELSAGVAGLGALTAVGEGVAATIARDKAPAVLGVLRPGRKAPALLRTSTDLVLDPRAISAGREVQFRGGDGRQSFARYYPPASATHKGPRGGVPPLLVLAHGGPTASAARGLVMRVQYYTSRGFAVMDVDYAGSTGYGRAYRERLDGQWGIADVADCAAAAQWAGREGLADAERMAIAGGSAGGYTVLMALATTRVFAAGSSHYGISDLSLLMEHTHKFEAGYLHRLLGTNSRNWRRVCEQRSPLTLIDGISSPVILFQGLEDKVVPPEQSRLIAERLREKKVPVELIELAGEGHGFRRADSIVTVLEAELSFLQKALKLG